MTEQLTAVVREGRVVIWTTPRWERHLPPACVIVLISLHVRANSPDRSPASCSRPKRAGKWPHIGRLLSSDRQGTGNSVTHLRCSENDYRNKLSRSGKQRHLTELGVQLFKPGPRHRQSWLNSCESFVSPPGPIRIIRPQHKDILYFNYTSTTCFTPVCFTPFCSNTPCQFKHINLRSLIFCLTQFDWLLSIMR